MTPEEKLAYAKSSAGRTKAQNYLYEMQNIDNMVALKLARLDDFREKHQRVVRSLYAMNGVGSANAENDTVKQLTEMENDLRAEYHALLERQRQTKETIRQVPNELQRTVLEMRYIDGLPFFRIAMAMNYEERTIYRLHRKALTQTALYLLESGQIEA